MKIPKPSEDSKKLFRANVPGDPRVTIRPMFGNESAFVNGNIFFGLFGDDLFVRLSEEDCQQLLENGASSLEPMKGRPMRGYVLLPKAYRSQKEVLNLWISRSLHWASKLPVKNTKK